MAELPAAFVEALHAERDALNARFRQRLHRGSRIDGDAFLRHLEQAVAPLVGQVHAVLPERSTSVVLALYDVSLDLFAASLLGPSAKMPWVRRVWTDLLPAAPVLLARQPQQTAGCLCNAVFQIASQRGARPDQWLARMTQVALHCQSVTELLEAGNVAAWLAGMVQFRQSALTTAARLRPELAARLFGLPEAISAEKLMAILDRMRDHVWQKIEVAAAAGRQTEIALVGTAGAFSGFGGLFFRPPVVSSDGQRLIVSDGKSQWELLADAYGCWLRRDEFPANRAASAGRSGPVVDRHGTIRWGNQSLALPHLARATSFAVCGETLAVTIPTSHDVFLFSRLGTPV